MAAAEAMLAGSSLAANSGGMFTEIMSPGQQQSKVVAVKPDRQPIPVVPHKMDDDYVGISKGDKLKPVEFDKIIRLLIDPHTCTFYERHILAIRKITRHYSKGFLMKDLVQISKIMNICADRIEQQNFSYIDPLSDLVALCGLPFLMEKSSDELAYRQIATETLSQLGYLLRVNDTKVRMQICKSLILLYSNDSFEPNLQNLKPCSLEYNQNLFAESDLPEALVKSLSLVEDEINIRVAVIDVLQKLSRKSDKCCSKMLSANAAHRLCCSLMDHDPSGELLFRSVEVIWNLLEKGDINEVVQQLSYQRCIIQIRDAFLHQLSRGYSHYDRQLRNDLIVIATMIAAANYTAPFLETGFAKQLVLFATFQEVKSHNPLVKSLKLMKNHEDFELKKLLINFLIILSNDPSSIPVYSEGHFMLALFTYMRNNDNSAKPQEWTPSYFEEIQLHALAALCTLAPKMLDDYMQCNGSTRALLLLEWCIGPDDYGGHGNSFHGAGGRGNKRSQMRYSLRFIYSMVSMGEETVIQEFVDQGAIGMLNGILTSVNQSMLDDDAVDVDIQCDILLILGTLCENDIHRKELFGNEGVDNLVRYLRIDRTKLNAGLGHHRLLMAAIEGVWSAVLGCYTVEDYFLEKEGSFLLLDLLEYCPQTMFNQILGCLLDLTENSKAIPHINTWRGREGSQSAPHLFCEIWRQEEDRIGVLRHNSGAMADLRYPMMSAEQRETDVIVQAADESSYSIVEVAENLRAKIYGLFCRIGYSELPGITVEDHVTLTIIERYLDFKMGEVWAEIHLELENEGIRPISPDLEALEWIGRSVEEESVQVARTQAELFEAQAQQDELEEQEHYNEIRENHRQKEKTLQDFADFVARTSNYDKLKEAKEKQLISVEASRIRNMYKSGDNFHSADIANIHTTVFSSQLVKVESTPTEIFGGYLAAAKRFAVPNAKRGGNTGREVSARQETDRSMDLLS